LEVYSNCKLKEEIKMKNIGKLAFATYIAFAVVALFLGCMLDFEFWLEYTIQVVALLVVLFWTFLSLYTMSKIVKEDERRKLRKQLRKWSRNLKLKRI